MLLAALTLSVGLFALPFFRRNPINNSTETKKLSVAASFYPLYFFAKEVGGTRVMVENLTPAGAEPHDFEPGAQDIAKLEMTDLLLVNGAGFEPWLEKVQEGLSDTVKIIPVAEGLVENNDPHVWLDPILAEKEVSIIAQTLTDLDPAGASYYDQNAKVLQHRLAVLDQEFRNGLGACKQRSIVTSHEAFGYLVKRYNLEQVGVNGVSPEQEPTPAELAELTRFAKANRVKYIFFETLLSPRLAETIATEVGAKILVLDPLEGVTPDDEAAGLDYFSIQRQNVANLQLALECE